MMSKLLVILHPDKIIVLTVLGIVAFGLLIIRLYEQHPIVARRRKGIFFGNFMLLLLLIAWHFYQKGQKTGILITGLAAVAVGKYLHDEQNGSVE